MLSNGQKGASLAKTYGVGISNITRMKVRTICFKTGLRRRNGIKKNRTT